MKYSLNAPCECGHEYAAHWGEEGCTECKGCQGAGGFRPKPIGALTKEQEEERMRSLVVGIGNLVLDIWESADVHQRLALINTTEDYVRLLAARWDK